MKSIHIFLKSIQVEHALRTQHRKLEIQYSAFSYEVKIKHGTSSENKIEKKIVIWGGAYRQS
jgi:hypothetical protein